MGEMWRLIDSGLRSPAQNIALDRALLEARAADEIPSTLRFSRFAPCVLIGCSQSPAHEVDLEYCAAADLVVQRRLSSGDAVYCDSAQLAWSLYLHRLDLGAADMQSVARRIGHAAATALNATGIAACFRAPHDLEADGRTVGTGGGVAEGDAILYQGMLNIDLDFAAVLSATRTPALGLGGHAMSAARARMTDLKSALGKTVDAGILRECLIAAFENEFSAELHDADLSLTEHARYRNALAEIDTPDWINLVSAPAADIQVAAATQPRVSGAMNVTMLYDRSRRRIKQVWFTTDSGLLPSSGITGLEAVLRDTSVERLERNVHAFFAAGHELQSLKASEIISLLRRVLQLPLVVPHP